MKTGHRWITAVLLLLILVLIAMIAMVGVHLYRDHPGEKRNRYESSETEPEAVSGTHGRRAAEENSGEAGADAVPEDSDDGDDGVVTGVEDLTFTRESATSILLQWSAETGMPEASCVVMRKDLAGNIRSGQWEKIGAVSAEAGETGKRYTFRDTLESSEAQQYLYRVDLLPDQDLQDSLVRGEAIPASNRIVCIDPGHYHQSFLLQGENLYGYGEGDFVLRVGLKLREELRDRYGIDTRMTRESDHIVLDGYEDGELDGSHLSLRGEYARGCDLFFSIHTNANLDHANGYPTCNQPASIGKTIILVNRVAAGSETALLQADTVGENLSRLNGDMGIAGTGAFRTGSTGTLPEWSDAWNDALGTPGGVCFRLNENGEDYYGVLRGSSQAGVPGMIVEHCHHTSEAMRKAAMQGDLDTRWAEADAAGIAAGWRFQKYTR